MVTVRDPVPKKETIAEKMRHLVGAYDAKETKKAEEALPVALRVCLKRIEMMASLGKRSTDFSKVNLPNDRDWSRALKILLAKELKAEGFITYYVLDVPDTLPDVINIRW